MGSLLQVTLPITLLMAYIANLLMGPEHRLEFNIPQKPTLILQAPIYTYIYIYLFIYLYFLHT